MDRFYSKNAKGGRDCPRTMKLNFYNNILIHFAHNTCIRKLGIIQLLAELPSFIGSLVCCDEPLKCWHASGIDRLSM